MVSISVLVIVPCGKRKIWDKNPEAGPCEARDVYRGSLFKVCREYADRWVILSAKYGFVDPDFIIPENYDVTFKDLGTNPVKVEQLREQAEEMGLDEYGKIVVLGGKEYINVVAKVFIERHGLKLLG